MRAVLANQLHDGVLGRLARRLRGQDVRQKTVAGLVFFAAGLYFEPVSAEARGAGPANHGCELVPLCHQAREGAQRDTNKSTQMTMGRPHIFNISLMFLLPLHFPTHSQASPHIFPYLDNVSKI